MQSLSLCFTSSFWLCIELLADVPEGCVLIREHIPITNLFTCLWFNEVDRFTSRDQLSFAMVRDKIMSIVNWSIDMFLDCERRNFVIQVLNSFLLVREKNACMQLKKSLSYITKHSLIHFTETYNSI